MINILSLFYCLVIGIRMKTKSNGNWDAKILRKLSREKIISSFQFENEQENEVLWFDNDDKRDFYWKLLFLLEVTSHFAECYWRKLKELVSDRKKGSLGVDSLRNWQNLNIKNQGFVAVAARNWNFLAPVSRVMALDAKADAQQNLRFATKPWQITLNIEKHRITTNKQPRAVIKFQQCPPLEQ